MLVFFPVLYLSAFCEVAGRALLARLAGWLKGPDLPPALAQTIHRALAKDPAQRFPDARAFRMALMAAGS